jgi:hypothetical protein
MGATNSAARSMRKRPRSLQVRILWLIEKKFDVLCCLFV